MTLTPIRIRGKRKPKAPAAAASPMSATYYDELPLPPSQKPKRSVSAAIAHRKISRPRSSIEDLPIEILESILLYCRSFALPRASHLIGAKLSGKATLYKLFFAGFHETWKHGFGKPREVRRLTSPPGSEDPELQSELLRLPWVNLDFLLEAQQVWADKFARDRPVHYWLHNDFVPGSGERKDGESYLFRESSLNAREYFEADYKVACYRAATRPEQIAMPQPRLHHIHPRARIPSSLIAGPWTEEQRQRIFWLVRAGAKGHCDPKWRPPWETRVSTIKNMAIYASEPERLVENCFADQCIDHDWLYKGLPRDVMGDMMEEIETRLKWGGDGEDMRDMLRRVSTELRNELDGIGYEEYAEKG